MAQKINSSMPESPDIGPNFTLRVTALSPTTGALVPNVKVDTVVIDVTQVLGTTDGLQAGQWFLVPGPNA